MEKYNYKKVMKDDIREYIENNVDFSEYEDMDEAHEKLYDDMFVCDSITGNANGSYTFNTWQAEENLCHNWDLLAYAIEDFCCEENPVEKGAEWCDVIIRCYLLDKCLDEVLEEYEKEFE